ncbi:MAG TPA: ankyrin repeat domain-containing protein [Candidatus Babeliales bacterium]|nr:ankyrin repeat domain-containing protein [Candidatus Babeliales bacterium]
MIKRAECILALFLFTVAQADPLLDAINQGNVAAVAQNAKSGNRTIDYSYPGTTYLMVAVRKKNIPVIRELLKKENGIDVNFMNLSGRTALHYAQEDNALNVVQELLKAGASATLSAGPDSAVGVFANAKDEHMDGISPLIEAMLTGKTAIFDEMLKPEYHVDLNARNYLGKTALQIAVEKGNVDAARKLVAAGADQNVKDNNGNSAYSIALSKNDQPMLELFKASGAGAGINATEQLWEMISAGGDPKEITALLNQDADVNAKNPAGLTAILMAYKQVKMPIFNYLLTLAGQIGTKEFIPDLNVRDNEGKTLFHLMIERTDLDSLRKLFDAVPNNFKNRMANPNIADNNGVTPLVEAVTTKSPAAIIDELLKKSDNRINVDLNAANNQGMTAFRFAIKVGNYSAAKKLIKAGASNNAPESLIDVIVANNMNGLNELLTPDYHINVNAQRGGDNKTALMVAAERNNLPAAKALVEHGADTNIISNIYIPGQGYPCGTNTTIQQPAVDFATSQEMKDYLRPLTKVQGKTIRQDYCHETAY